MSRFGTIGTQFFDDAGDPLIGGSIDFYEPGTTARKTTYADANYTTANSNPVTLTGSGRLPSNVYYTGLVDAVLRNSDGVTIETRYSIGDENTQPFSAYSSTAIYSADQIVQASDGNYYRSLSANNQNNSPLSTPTKWARVEFVDTWNTNVTYNAGDVVQGTDGELYTSKAGSNTGNNPGTDTTNWQLGRTVGDVVFSADSTKYAAPSWLKCDGQSYNTTTYALLAAKLGKFPVGLADPASLPAGACYGGDFSPSDTFLAFAHASTPYISIYERAGDTFTKLSNPATLPAGQCYGAAFNYDASYLAVAHINTPCVTIYSISGTTFTKITNPSTLPASIANDCKFSPDNNYLSVAHASSPFLTIYDTTSVPFAKVTNPATLPATTCNSTAWTSDSKFLAVAVVNITGCIVYENVSGTFTKLTDLPNVPDTCKVCAWSNDDAYLAIGGQNAPYLQLYSFDADAKTFTEMTNPTTQLPAGTVNGITWSANNDRLYISTTVSPYIYTYKHDSGVLTLIDSPNGINSTGHNASVKSRTGNYVAFALQASPYLEVFKMSDALPSMGAADGTGSVDAYIKTGL